MGTIKRQVIEDSDPSETEIEMSPLAKKHKGWVLMEHTKKKATNTDHLMISFINRTMKVGTLSSLLIICI